MNEDAGRFDFNDDRTKNNGYLQPRTERSAITSNAVLSPLFVVDWTLSELYLFVWRLFVWRRLATFARLFVRLAAFVHVLCSFV